RIVDGPRFQQDGHGHYGQRGPVHDQHGHAVLRHHAGHCDLGGVGRTRQDAPDRKHGEEECGADHRAPRAAWAPSDLDGRGMRMPTVRVSAFRYVRATRWTSSLVMRLSWFTYSAMYCQPAPTVS